MFYAEVNKELKSTDLVFEKDEKKGYFRFYNILDPSEQEYLVQFLNNCLKV